MSHVKFFQEIYRDFNNRDIEKVIALMTPDVKWANGMDGGYVFSHEGVREYWTRQFGLVSSKVAPLGLEEDGNIMRMKVHQVVHDLDGNLLADEMVTHVFELRDERIAAFDIEK